MVVHSFDIGIRHLGFASLRVTLDPAAARRFRFEILDWRVIDCAKIVDCEEADLNKSTLQGVIWITTNAWHKHKTQMIDDQEPPDWLFLEAQPMRNRKMQFVSHNLLSFLLGNWNSRGVSPQSCFVSGRVKLQEADFRTLFDQSNKAEAKREGRRRTTKEKRADDAKKYQENKKHAKLMTEVVLRENCDGENRLDWFKGLGYKRDDAADALLQGVYKARDLLENKPKRPKSPRRAMGVKFKTKRARPTPAPRRKAKRLATKADEDVCELS